jgi:hypothetical protein
MKVLSYNVRGLGGLDKRNEVCRLVFEKSLFVLCIQDGISFGFIKQFWTEMQDDFMRFLTEFHRNGKLTNGNNSTFIALIPKVDSPQRLHEFRFS